METQFTKGPWEIYEVEGSREVDFNGEHLIIWPENDGVIARLQHYSPVERRANARLIAASPEMFKALVWAKRFILQNCKNVQASDVEVIEKAIDSAINGLVKF